MLRGARAQSERPRKKLQDLGTAWKDIPEEHKPLYQKAVAEHWEEREKYGSVEAFIDGGVPTSATGRQPIPAAQ
eukprot:7987349-Pyramimonas_sp.AAC.1